ncbi:phosphate/phosphite/phosphonate ABC transporter substrate-binding protein [Massilia genomosp. 1]|uniref:PhnD/SsuA/transferrin family substrate-binding protein n=1 Tax=Massilia genomosp. 1 TaxID=2609280 RepID=A0ABX0MPJ7_9BURK|nr:PhnD/SsuA/transferrin family substrate-binding protein [Massilia genomosp. 1]NHZ64002.1 PhnD/SsuA/transferrin family substrate-binding protein [Massilia genomosp. 1]
MYQVSARVAAGYQALFEALLDVLRAEGMVDAVEFEREPVLPDFWKRPDMLLSQTCGYPYLTQLREHVHLLATPAYDLVGCAGADYASAIVVRQGGGIATLADARGRVAAANDIDSNSGMNALRHAVAPFARDGRFFSGVTWSGSHRASLALVQSGVADLAAIDCVTLGYLRREQPASLEGIAILGYSAPSPGLPFVTGAAVPDALRQRLREALLAPAAALAALLPALSIGHFAPYTAHDYQRIGALQAEAHARGYPHLA